jgi:hypothetical protein
VSAKPDFADTPEFYLTQCLRRLRYPLDPFEDTGLSAFDYAWKAFNLLYVQDQPEQAMEDGVTNNRMLFESCLAKWIPTDFVRNEKAWLDALVRVCSQEDVVPLDVERVLPEVGVQRRTLRNELSKGPSASVRDTTRLAVNILYKYRNYRFHGPASSVIEGVGGTGKVLGELTYRVALYIYCAKLKKDRPTFQRDLEARAKGLLRTIAKRIEADYAGGKE